ncbi:MAG: hypothetical protein CME06_09855 [Gemmatimonadetes bacterium]|nr:hypothetical protein [Gemmatimonadota bacterium]
MRGGRIGPRTTAEHTTDHRFSQAIGGIEYDPTHGPQIGKRAVGSMLLIERALVRRLEQRAEAAWPREICGLLVGQKGEERRLVCEAVPLANCADSSDAFSATPLDVLEVEQRARRGGLVVVGVFHSHPGGSASPSSADLKSAIDGYGRHHSWLILPIRLGRATDPSAWTLDRTGRRFAPEHLIDTD